MKKIAVFAAGTLFGSAGFKLLSSQDARKAYTQATAAALRCRDSVMTTVAQVQEAAGDILADAKEINETRAQAKETVEDAGPYEEDAEACVHPQKRRACNSAALPIDWRNKP